MASCGCGCGQTPAIAPRTDSRKGWVRGEPMRYVRHHQQRKSAAAYIEDEHGCWIWQRATSRGGYGTTCRDGKPMPAYRAYYEDRYGPIPPGMDLDHLCRVTACVRPEHLEPVTHAENMRRGANARLRHDDVRAIRRALTAGSSVVDEARRYGVNRATVQDIVSGRSWVGVS